MIDRVRFQRLESLYEFSEYKLKNQDKLKIIALE